jgi:hypothetical protein
MRLLTFILVLALVLPPVPLSACGMTGSESGPVEVAHGMHDLHAGHAATPAAAPADHTCCTDPAVPGECDPARHCVAGGSAVALAEIAAADAPCWRARHGLARISAELPPSHSTPPFRPPSA